MYKLASSGELLRRSFEPRSSDVKEVESEEKKEILSSNFDHYDDTFGNG